VVEVVVQRHIELQRMLRIDRRSLLGAAGAGVPQQLPVRMPAEPLSTLAGGWPPAQLPGSKNLSGSDRSGTPSRLRS